jgi:hypothetical protein
MRQAAVSPLLDWLLCSLFGVILFIQVLVDRFTPPRPSSPSTTNVLPRPRPPPLPPKPERPLTSPPRRVCKF